MYYNVVQYLLLRTDNTHLRTIIIIGYYLSASRMSFISIVINERHSALETLSAQQS